MEKKGTDSSGGIAVRPCALQAASQELRDSAIGKGSHNGRDQVARQALFFPSFQ